MASLKLIVGLAAVTTIGCSRGHSCQELEQHFRTPGFQPTDEARCSLELASLQAVSAPYGSIEQWRKAVSEPSISLLLTVAQKVVDRTSASDGSICTFNSYPLDVPGKGGIAPGEADWNDSPLGRLGIARPDRLYGSYSVSRDGQRSKPDAPLVRFLLTHDFDHDGKAGTLSLEGFVHVGRKFYQTGFERTDTSSTGLIAE